MPAGLPTSVTTEIEFTAGVWTDVSTFVKGDSMEISVGRASSSSDLQPGTLTLDLDNADGTWTPDNPLSTYYPNFVEGKRIRVRVLKSASTYYRFVGRISALVPDFPLEPTQSVTHLSAVDSLGDLQRVTLANLAQEYAIAANPTAAYYPLTDTNSNVGLVDINGVAGNGYLSETASVDFASVEYPLRSESVLQINSGTVRIPAQCQTFSVKLGSTSGTVLAFNPQSATPDLLTWTTGGWRDGGGGALLFGNTAVSGLTPGWHTVALVAPSGVGTFTLWVDGVAGTGSASFGGGTPTAIDLYGPFAFANAGFFLTLTGTAVESNGGQTTANFFTYFASAIGATTLGVTFGGTSTLGQTMSAVDSEGKTALDVLLEAARVESGYAWHEYSASTTQTVRIMAAADSRSSTNSLTIDVEADADGGPTFERDTVRRALSATAISPAGSATYADSTQTGAVESVEVTGDWPTATTLAAAASDLVAQSKGNRLRASSVTVDLATASNDLYASFFALTPGKRIRVGNLPSSHFGVTYMEGYVEGWTESPSVNGYKVTLDLSPADAPPEGIFDDATYSVIGWGDGVCTLTSGITSSATSLSLTFTGTALLSTSAGDYPLDLDLNGERVTITAAPAGGTSPRTVTVTRGVAPTVARAHSAGEPVDVWNAARIAL
jgi:hypothetical protein